VGFLRDAAAVELKRSFDLPLGCVDLLLGGLNFTVRRTNGCPDCAYCSANGQKTRDDRLPVADCL
jgi:hypothetical protein